MAEHIAAAIGLLLLAVGVTYFVACAIYPFKAKKPVEPFDDSKDWGSQ